MNGLPEWMSLLPAVVAIAYVLWRKDVIVALILAIFTSEWLLGMNGGDYSPFTGFIAMIERVVAVFSDAGNARLLLFSTLIGVPLAYMRFSGGVSAMVHRLVNAGVATNARRTGLLTFSTGVVVFIESNLSVLTAGILSRGLFDKFKMSRERLAYIVDSTSAPICILILLNGWGAFVLGLIAPYELGVSSVSVLVATVPLNIYALSTLAVVFYTVWTGRVYGPMATTETALAATVPDETVPEPGRARDMLIPLAVIVISMLGFMWWTGNGDIMAGSGSRSVLYATVLATTVSFLLLISQPRFTHKQLIDEGFKGVGEILPLVTILLLSIALVPVLRLWVPVFIFLAWSPIIYRCLWCPR